MTKTTTRIAAFAAALAFGAATIVPMAASAQGTGTTSPSTTPSTTEPSAAAPSTTAPSSTSMPAKKMGMHHGMHHGSQNVSAAQDALNKEGANLKVDGRYGPKTRAAIKSYQQAHGLKATGHLDKSTRDALKLS
jgi:peptidoglycan DL-endopeptidase CwlO